MDRELLGLDVPRIRTDNDGDFDGGPALRALTSAIQSSDSDSLRTILVSLVGDDDLGETYSEFATEVVSDAYIVKQKGATVRLYFHLGPLHKFARNHNLYL
jgi:hypothetical protein